MTAQSMRKCKTPVGERWSEVQTQVSELCQKMTNIKFPGRGQRDDQRQCNDRRPTLTRRLMMTTRSDPSGQTEFIVPRSHFGPSSSFAPSSGHRLRRIARDVAAILGTHVGEACCRWPCAGVLLQRGRRIPRWVL